MFTQDEANSMLLAGKLVDKMADKSVRFAFDSALHKIKSVLNEAGKDDLQNLDSHIGVFLRSRFEYREQNDFPDHFMADIQRSIARKHVVKIEYSSRSEEISNRCIEPIGMFYYSMAWYLIGWCRMRNGYRNFRADRIKSMTDTGEVFETRSTLSLQEHFQSMHNENQSLIKVVAIFNKNSLRGRPLYGSTAQEDLGEKLRSEFMIDQLDYMAHWLLLFGTAVEIVEPEELKTRMQNITKVLHFHYNVQEDIPQS
jgi:predicted DNA-binding transcriptional regulator YafY